MLRTLVPLRRTVAAAIFVVASASPLAAQMTNATLTFDNAGAPAAGGVRRVNNCYVENGIRVTVLELAGGVGPGLVPLNCPTTPPTANTATALYTYAPGNASYRNSPALINDVGSAVEFTNAVMGGSFSLFSLDLLPITLVPAGTPLSLVGELPVTFSAVTIGGVSLAPQVFSLALNAQTFRTFTLNYTDIRSARVTFGGPDFSAQIDNVNVAVNASVIPEPSTYALMATGLLGLAGIARRRRTTNTPS
jgi:hypothetical protein